VPPREAHEALEERPGGIAEPGRVPEQVPNRSLRVAAPRGVPPADRIVEAQAALLGQAQRERRGGDLRDAV